MLSSFQLGTYSRFRSPSSNTQFGKLKIIIDTVVEKNRSATWAAIFRNVYLYMGSHNASIQKLTANQIEVHKAMSSNHPIQIVLDKYMIQHYYVRKTNLKSELCFEGTKRVIICTESNLIIVLIHQQSTVVLIKDSLYWISGNFEPPYN